MLATGAVSHDKATEGVLYGCWWCSSTCKDESATWTSIQVYILKFFILMLPALC